MVTVRNVKNYLEVLVMELSYSVLLVESDGRSAKVVESRKEEALFLGVKIKWDMDLYECQSKTILP